MHIYIYNFVTFQDSTKTFIFLHIKDIFVKETALDTYGGGEVGNSQLHSRHKKGHMNNIYLTGSNEVAIVDFVKNHEELYDKTNEHFKDKVSKERLTERFANSHKLSVKVCKTWFESQRTHHGKHTQSKSGWALKE